MLHCLYLVCDVFLHHVILFCSFVLELIAIVGLYSAFFEMHLNESQSRQFNVLVISH